MKLGTQFKINREQDVRKEYKKQEFCFSLERELYDYSTGKNWLVKDKNGNTTVGVCQPELEIVPNPYTKKRKPTCELGKAMQQVEKEAAKLGYSMEITFNQINK